MTDAIQETSSFGPHIGKFHPGALAVARGTQLAVMLVTALLTYRGLCLLVPADRAQNMAGHSPVALQTTNSDQIHAAQAAPLAPGSVIGHGPVVQEIPMQTEVVPSRHARRHALTGHHAFHRNAPQSRRQHRPGSFSAILPHESLHSALGAELGPHLQPDLGLVPQTVVLPVREKLEVSSLVLVKPYAGQKNLASD